MKDLAKTALVLVVVAFVSAAALSVVDRLTRERIKKVEKQKEIKARKKVLPAAAVYRKCSEKEFKTLISRAQKIVGDSQKLHSVKSRILTPYYAGYDKDGQLVGYVYNVVSPDGYNGDIKMVVGITVATNNSYGIPQVSDYSVIKSGETPGLGKDAEVKLHNFFTNSAVIAKSYNKQKADTNSGASKKYPPKKSLANINPTDKSDAISGATITSCAIKDALYTCLRATLSILERDSVNLNVPKRDLALVPYARTLEPVAITNSVSLLREMYQAKFFQRTMGYVFKATYKVAEKKIVALFGIQAANKRVYLTKVYQSTFDKRLPFRPQLYNQRLYTFADRTKLEKAEPTNAIDKSFVKAILEAYTILQKRGIVQ